MMQVITDKNIQQNTLCSSWYVLYLDMKNIWSIHLNEIQNRC